MLLLHIRYKSGFHSWLDLAYKVLLRVTVPQPLACSDHGVWGCPRALSLSVHYPTVPQVGLANLIDKGEHIQVSKVFFSGLEAGICPGVTR